MTILIPIYWLIAALLFWKVFVYLQLPFEIFKRSKAGDQGGISLMPAVEIISLLIITVIAYFLDNTSFIYTTLGTLIVFGGLLVFSYLWMFSSLRVIQVILKKQKK